MRSRRGAFAVRYYRQPNQGVLHLRATTSVAGVPYSIKTTALKINSGEPRIHARQLPTNVARVLRGLHRAGYRACVVGGGVRDLLLNLKPKDFDIVTDARPEQVKKLFRRVLLIGRRFRLAHVMFGREYIEVATFRGTGEETSDSKGQVVTGNNGRILRDNRFGSLEEDVLRRDFTINALYWDYADGRIIDHVGGLKDIAARRLRLIGEPRLRYEEDPVRMLRGARFAAKLGCKLDARCAKPIPKMSRLLRAEPPARLLEEVRKLFLAGHAIASFEQLRRFGLLDELFPFLGPWMDAEPKAGEFVRDALAATDRRLSEGSHASLMFLLCVFYWGPTSRAVAAGGSKIPRYRQITDAFRGIVQDSKYGLRPTKRMMADMEDVLSRQALLEAHPRRRVNQTLKHPLFRPAYRLLCLRRRLGEIDEQCVLYWQKRAGLAPSRSWSKRRRVKSGRGGKRSAHGNEKTVR